MTYVSDFVREMRERWNNRLVFPLTKLRERYLSGNLELATVCRLGGKRILIGYKSADNSPEDKSPGNDELCVEARDNQDERVVLVHTVQLMDDGKWFVSRIRTLVWLQIFDESTCGAVGDPLYVSVVTGLSSFIRRSDQNRKSNQSRMLSPVLITGETPCDVIEAGTPMVNDLARKRAESRRDDSIFVEVNPLLSLISLGLSSTRVGAVLDESVDLDAEIEDILVGPF